MIDLINAISVRLYDIFEGRYAIYLEPVEQGLVTPCFFIQPIYTLDENMIENRKYREYDFDIAFIPGSKVYRELFADVTERLFASFDSVEVKDKVLPTFDRNVQVVEDVLHFAVKFKYYIYTKQVEAPLMDDLEMSVME